MPSEDEHVTKPAVKKKPRRTAAKRTSKRASRSPTKERDFDDGTLDVCSSMVMSGFAWWYRAYSKDPRIAELEKMARDDKRGLWIDPAAMPPWEYRKRKKEGTLPKLPMLWRPKNDFDQPPLISI